MLAKLKKLLIEPTQFKFILILALSMSCVSSCSSSRNLPDESTNFVTETIQHEGVTRTYHIYFPKNFTTTKASPMALALHGGGGMGLKFEQHATAGTLTAAAEKRGVVLVFPEGIDKRWNSGRKEIFNGAKRYDDVGFLAALIDKMIGEYGIDASRVYATGISNGGFMSIRLALDLSEKISAVAPVTAQISVINEDKRPKQPVSFMLINGTKDPLVPYNGGHIRLFKFGRSRGRIVSTQSTINRFRNFNQCTNRAEKELINTFSNDKTQVEIIKYSECNDDSEVVLIKVIGGGHTWPGGVQYLPAKKVGVVSKEINASELILDFFLKHKKSDI